MAKVVTAITATVEHITGIKAGQYGDYRSVLFKDAAGEKIWKSFNPEAEELDYLTKGTRVQLVPTTEKGGKVSHNIVLLDAPATVPQSETPQSLPPAAGLSPEQKRAIASYVNEQGDLLSFCWATARAKLGNDLGEESIRCAASTLYISAQRKFQL